MRATLVLFAGLVLAVPLAAQAQEPSVDGTPFFLRKQQSPEEALKAYRDKPYRPVRPSEARAAAFLTEEREFAFGVALGPTAPPQVQAFGSTAVTQIGSFFAVNPPEGGSYRPGDTLTVAIRRPGPRGWGDIIQPTGLVVVTGVTPTQTVAAVARIFGPMRQGQVVLPTEPVPSLGEVTPVPTDAGPTGVVIGSVEMRELIIPGGHLFIELGRDDGLRHGDFVEVRRPVTSRTNAADTVEETMATGQVVHLNGATSTIRLFNVESPDIPAGTPAVRIATLP
jgi:hypothetical protein